MRFCVSVPVLSEQMVVTEPSVSTEGRRRTSALTATMRRAPSASSTVTTAGSASGMAATARLMAVSAMSSGASPRSTPTTKTMAQMPSTASASRLPNAARRSCSGVLRSSPPSSRATLPSSVCMPVATTRPRARPWVAVVPLKAMFTRSPRALASCAARVPVCLATVTDSPVSADSSTWSCAISIRRRSAGIWLPASSSTMSPGTSALAGTTCTSPLRSTVACAAASWRSAAMAWSARQACIKPMSALSTTITRMTTVSVASPTSPETTAAPSSTSTMKSLNCSINSASSPRRAWSCSSLAPCCAARRVASSACRPVSGSTPWACASSCASRRWASWVGVVGMVSVAMRSSLPTGFAEGTAPVYGPALVLQARTTAIKCYKNNSYLRFIDERRRPFSLKDFRRAFSVSPWGVPGRRSAVAPAPGSAPGA